MTKFGYITRYITKIVMYNNFYLPFGTQTACSVTMCKSYSMICNAKMAI